MLLRLVGAALALLAVGRPSDAEITRVWLSHRTNDPSRIVVNWETETPGNSVVHFGPNADALQTVTVDEQVTLHHVEIPLAPDQEIYHYRVATGNDRSADATFRGYTGSELRVAVVADWQRRPKLDSLLRDAPHLLLTAGDNIASLHPRCGAGVTDCTKPYGALIDAYPELFCSTPFLPVLGNHDREIRPRGDKPPAEAVYDIEATAFRKFFELPEDEWKWHFDIPAFGVRLIALDFSHTSDMGTTWQTCHSLSKDEAQYVWYEKLMTGPLPRWTITLYNEKHSIIRGKESGAWQALLRRGTLAITGFGYFAERAQADGLTCLNTSLQGQGDKYPDPQGQFFSSEASYVLLTFTRNPPAMRAALKGLDGQVLDCP